MEGVERNAYRKYHFQQKPIRGDVEQLCELGDEEVVILEQGKDAKVKHNVERRPCLRLLPSFCFSDEHPATPRTKRCKCDEQQKTPVPPTVEHIACYNYKSVLQLQLPLRLADEAVEDKPIEQKDYRQEYRELDGIEEHIRLRFCGCKGTDYFNT